MLPPPPPGMVTSGQAPSGMPGGVGSLPVDAASTHAALHQLNEAGEGVEESKEITRMLWILLKFLVELKLST